MTLEKVSKKLNMKEVLHCLLCVVVCLSYVVSQEMTIPVGEDGRDTLTTIRVQDTFGNYDVGYNENQLTGGASFYREKGFANGTRTGSYGYTTRNGLIRIVTYVADQDGYRAELLTNEPGVGASNPSNVTVTKEKEPDPGALAEVPTGYQSTGNMAASSSEVVKNYVMMSAGTEHSSRNSESDLGNGRVKMSSPYGTYEYFV